MALDPLEVLAPNSMGYDLENRGVDEMVMNRGLGVTEAMPEGMTDRETSANPALAKDRLRTAKAREFGKTKATVGF
jgi:hypothetical protein